MPNKKRVAAAEFVDQTKFAAEGKTVSFSLLREDEEDPIMKAPETLRDAIMLANALGAAMNGDGFCACTMPDQCKSVREYLRMSMPERNKSRKVRYQIFDLCTACEASWHMDIALHRLYLLRSEQRADQYRKDAAATRPWNVKR